MSEEEKSDLFRLLREFRNIFAWEYSEMPRLDPSLVVHTLNVEPGTIIEGYKGLCLDERKVVPQNARRDPVKMCGA